MKIFISWSGATSRALALAFKGWLPVMFGGISVFVSSEDIDKGARWATELDSELDNTDFGLLCLTPDNLRAPWILYEAGALAKSVEKGRCTCVLHDVAKSTLEHPLARFQSTSLDKADMLLLIKSINKQLGPASQGEPALEKRFEALWPQLKDELAKVEALGQVVPAKPERSDRALLEEVLATVRTLTATVDSAVSPEVDAGVMDESSSEVPIIRARWMKPS